MDARVKLVASLALVVAVVTLRSPAALALALAGTGALLLASGLGPGRLLRRTLVVFPFGGLAGLALAFTTPGEPVLPLGPPAWGLAVIGAGARAALLVVLRVWAAVWAAGLFTATTRLDEALRGLRAIGMPALMTTLAALTVRYVPVASGEFQRMWRGRLARGFVPRGILHQPARSGLGALFGMLFLRSLDRSERLYRAMLARGLGHPARPVRAGPVALTHALAGAALVSFALGLFLWDRGWPW